MPKVTNEAGMTQFRADFWLYGKYREASIRDKNQPGGAKKILRGTAMPHVDENLYTAGSPFSKKRISS